MCKTLVGNRDETWVDILVGNLEKLSEKVELYTFFIWKVKISTKRYTKITHSFREGFTQHFHRN